MWPINIDQRKMILMVAMVIGLEKHLWCVGCMEKFCRNFEWRLEAHEWLDEDDFGDVE